MGKLQILRNQKVLGLVGALFIFASMESASRALAQDASGLPPQTVGNSDDPQAEREEFVKEIRRVENLNRKYTEEIEDIKNLLADKDADYQRRMQDLEDKLESQQNNQQAQQEVTQEQTQATTQELETKTNEMLSKGGDLDPQDQSFRTELAKAHYNMGNIYFERGEYQRAVVEYYQAVDLTPNDPDTHYNLAFVSGEYLGDQETALKHYQWYLYLKPNAPDTAAVKEKIIQAKLTLRSQIDSPIENQDGNFNLTR